MKQQVSPVAAVIAVLVVVGIAVLAYVKFGSVSHSEVAPPAMPASVQQEWQKYTGGAPPGKGGSSGPNGTGTIPGSGQMPTTGGPGMPVMGGAPPGAPR